MLNEYFVILRSSIHQRLLLHYTKKQSSYSTKSCARNGLLTALMGTYETWTWVEFAVWHVQTNSQNQIDIAFTFTCVTSTTLTDVVSAILIHLCKGIFIIHTSTYSSLLVCYMYIKELLVSIYKCNL